MRVMKHLKHKLTVLCTLILVASCCIGLAEPAAAKPVPRDPVPYLSSSSMEVGCTNKTYSVTVYNANSITSVSSTVNWMSVTRSGNVVKCTVQANTSTNNRYGHVKMTVDGYTLSLYVTQWAPIFIRNGGPSAAAITYLAMDGASSNGSSGSRASIFINSAGTIRVSSNASWLTVSLSGHYATLIASPNYSGGSRNATITVSNGKDSKTLTVSQRVYVPNYDNIPYASVPAPTAALKSAATPLLNGIWVDEFYHRVSDEVAAQAKRLGRTVTQAEYDIIMDMVTLQLIDEYYLPFYDKAVAFVGVNAPRPVITRLSTLPDGRPDLGDYNPNTNTVTINFDLLMANPQGAVAHTFHVLFHIKQRNVARYNGTLLQYVYMYNIRHKVPNDDTDFLDRDAYHYGEMMVRNMLP